MKRLFLLFLNISLVISAFTSCGYKTSNSIDVDITTISKDDMNETTEESIFDCSEESSKSTTYTETVNITETMEDIKTDNGVVGDSDHRPLIEYNYEIEKVGNQYYMVLNDYTPSGELPYGSTEYNYISAPITYTGMSALDMLKYGIPTGQIGRVGNSIIGTLLYFVSKEDNIGLKLYDADHIWKPKALPYPWKLREIASDESSDIVVAWSGETYRFQAEKSDSQPMSTSMWIEILTESRFLSDMAECEARSTDKKTFSNESKTATVITASSRQYIFITNGQYFVKIECDSDDISEEDYLTFEFEEYLG